MGFALPDVSPVRGLHIIFSSMFIVFQVALVLFSFAGTGLLD